MTRSDLAKMAGCPVSFLNHAAAQDTLEFAILTRANETQPNHSYDAEAAPAMVAEREIIRRIDWWRSPQPASASRARSKFERIFDTYLDELRTAQKAAGGGDG